MDRRARAGPRQGIARGRRWPAARALAALGAAVAACAGGPGTGGPGSEADALAAWLRETPPPPGAVVVRLAFGDAADLDLYVTGPLAETVYFANTPTRVGGRLERDLRCGAGPRRIEQVVYPDPVAGPYRVGVDFPERCDGARDPVAFVVEARGAAGVERRSGRIAPGEFEPIVLEWIEPAAGPAPSSGSED
jgi:hypothetical protein